MISTRLASRTEIPGIRKDLPKHGECRVPLHRKGILWNKINTVIHILNKDEKTTVKLMKIQIFYTQKRDRFINSIHPTNNVSCWRCQAFTEINHRFMGFFTKHQLAKVGPVGFMRGEGSWVGFGKGCPQLMRWKSNQLKYALCFKVETSEVPGSIISPHFRNLPIYSANTTSSRQSFSLGPFFAGWSCTNRKKQTGRLCTMQVAGAFSRIAYTSTANRKQTDSICWEDVEVVQSLYIRLWLLCHFHLDLNVCIYVYLYCIHICAQIRHFFLKSTTL